MNAAGSSGLRRAGACSYPEREPGSQASGLPWATYESRAEALRRGAAQRDAARELLDLDTAQQQQLFTRETRIKLERLLRDKAVNGSNPSCPEAAFIRAAQQLGGLINRIEVLAPTPPTGTARTNRTGAGKMLTLACARLRLGWLMREWDRADGEVDGLLLKAANDEDLPDLLASFGDAGLASDAPLPVLQLRLADIEGNTVQVDWRPDLDDVAMLRAAMLFAAEPALTLRLTSEPTLHAFCGPDSATPDLSVPSGLVPLARKLQTTAQTLLDSGINPAVLDAWTGSWVQACVEREAAGDATTAEALALAGAVRGGDRTAALTFLAPLKAEWVSQYHQALWQLLHRAEEPGTPVDPTDAVTTSSGVAHTTAAHHPAHLRLRTQDRPLLPTTEGRVWSLYGGTSSRDESGFAGATLRSVVIQLLTLQPEAAGHLRCLAWGPGSADLLAREAVRLIGTRAGKATVNRVEIFCIGEGPRRQATLGDPGMGRRRAAGWPRRTRTPIHQHSGRGEETAAPDCRHSGGTSRARDRPDRRRQPAPDRITRSPPTRRGLRSALYASGVAAGQARPAHLADAPGSNACRPALAEASECRRRGLARARRADSGTRSTHRDARHRHPAATSPRPSPLGRHPRQVRHQRQPGAGSGP